MDDTISRQAAIEAVQNRRFTLSKEKVLLINDLEKLPSAQPKRGKWQYNGKHGTFKIYTCDKCGWNYEAKHNYCPNCGADMREVTT